MKKDRDIYTLTCLKGTKSFVLRELLEKFPDSVIQKESEKEILFSSNQKDIEIFRNLYSPTHIKSDSGTVLNLSRREWRKGYIPAGINPSLAYIMCMIAELREQDILYDPFCGSSVIPITALKYFNIKRVICSDVSSKAIFTSKLNFQSAGIEERRHKLFRSSIEDVKLAKKNVDKIVSNLPFGIRTGSHEENINLYFALEKIAQKLLRTQGMLVLLTQEKKLLRDVFKKDDWDLKSVATVNEGGLLPEIFVVKRK